MLFLNDVKGMNNINMVNLKASVMKDLNFSALIKKMQLEFPKGADF